MPLLELTTDTLTWRCPRCGGDATHSLADLEAGDGRNRDVVRLPLCTHCGSLSVLNRTWDDPVSGAEHTPRERQRGVVNRLHAMLKGRRQIAASVRDVVEAERDEPPVRAPEPTAETPQRITHPVSRPRAPRAQWAPGVAERVDAEVATRETVRSTVRAAKQAAIQAALAQAAGRGQGGA